MQVRYKPGESRRVRFIVRVDLSLSAYYKQVCDRHKVNPRTTFLPRTNWGLTSGGLYQKWDFNSRLKNGFIVRLMRLAVSTARMDQVNLHPVGMPGGRPDVYST